uniref:type II toxin-antitoxin system ParD family antitoxin n=1 Tax=uncultured Sphingomonas sp. TaxID=158754 RepID=UPI0035C9ACE7
MASRVNLGEPLDEYVDQLVHSGRFDSRTEVLREGVRLVRERETWQDYVDERVAAGIAADDAGDVVDGEAFFEELLAKYAATTKPA